MRTVDSISFGNTPLPSPGKYPFIVADIGKGVSQRKKTPFVEPLLLVNDGEYQFSDQLYVVGKALSRLCLFARRICNMPDDFELSDNDQTAANEVAKYIMENAKGCSGVVRIEENEEKFMPESGPDAGRMITKMRKRVAFLGYERDMPSLRAKEEGAAQQEDDLPF